ncbi:MAG: hypothetical protein PUE68_06165 [Kiritimatiellae bacterium]|nr:hypothetical protein [Kiritimatiellia bacterium]
MSRSKRNRFRRRLSQKESVINRHRPRKGKSVRINRERSRFFETHVLFGIGTDKNRFAVLHIAHGRRQRIVRHTARSAVDCRLPSAKHVTAGRHGKVFGVQVRRLRICVPISRVADLELEFRNRTRIRPINIRHANDSRLGKIIARQESIIAEKRIS